MKCTMFPKKNTPYRGRARASHTQMSLFSSPFQRDVTCAVRCTSTNFSRRGSEQLDGGLQPPFLFTTAHIPYMPGVCPPFDKARQCGFPLGKYNNMFPLENATEQDLPFPLCRVFSRTTTTCCASTRAARLRTLVASPAATASPAVTAAPTIDVISAVLEVVIAAGATVFR